MKMREIADAAGVSLTTVSLVLNGKPGIGDEKRALVTRLLQENGYQIRPEDAPQRIHAHSNLCFLKYSKHSYLVNGNPGFVTQIMDAAGEECRRHGYNLLVNAFSDFSAINRLLSPKFYFSFPLPPLTLFYSIVSYIPSLHCICSCFLIIYTHQGTIM